MYFCLANFRIKPNQFRQFEIAFAAGIELLTKVSDFAWHELMRDADHVSYKLLLNLNMDRDEAEVLNFFDDFQERFAPFLDSVVEFKEFERAYATPLQESVLEVAMLNVIPGRESEFELAFKQASKIISSMKGFVHLQLQRCLERPNGYVLLVNWETLADHTVGFRQSSEYQEWRALLHHFYDPFPTVEHFVPINLE
jgi:heme-degrading monooxygenase HmoA